MNAVLLLILLLAVGRHLIRTGKRERAARVSAGHAVVGEGPMAQHPLIDVTSCIGCGACVTACPEHDVLAVLAGKAALINGSNCIGHGLCADACPVGAIQIVMAPPRMAAELPALTPEYESSIPDLFVAGELGGLALIKNAVNQGRDCIDVVARRIIRLRRTRLGAVVDVCIVGAGPAGLSASLRAVEKGLSYVTLEAEEFGGTVAKYPRQKLVMTSPVEFPGHGKFNKLEIGKEELLAFWNKAARKAGLVINTKERVETIRRDPDGAFSIETSQKRYRALTVVVAIGRRGSPRKLGVAGEQLAKVMYSLIDAEAYQDQAILVVGGGDSAVEAAMGLAHQPGNRVTLSYRKGEFTRLKDRNSQRIREMIRKGRISVRFNSEVTQIREDAVTLSEAGASRDLPNNYVFIFAGGTSPNAFLEKVGVQLGDRDLTDEAAKEAREVA